MIVHDSKRTATRTHRSGTAPNQRGQRVWVAALRGVASKSDPPIVGRVFCQLSLVLGVYEMTHPSLHFVGKQA